MHDSKHLTEFANTAANSSINYPGHDQGPRELEQRRRRIDELEAEFAETHGSGFGHSAAQERLEDFAASIGGWFWETDSELRFTYFSRSVFAITGVPAEWHYGKTREEIGMPDSVPAETWHEHLESLQRREPFSGFIFQRRAPDGIKWMRTSGAPVFDRDGLFQGYRGSASDITAEIDAKRRNDSLIGAIENLDEMFALWDSDDRLTVSNQRFRDINAQIMAGYQPGVLFEEHIRMAMEAGMYPAAVGQEEAWIRERLERHQNPGSPFEMQRQDGRWILLTEQRLPDGSTPTISADITAHKRIEQVLAEQNDILDTALATIPDGVQVLDGDLNLVAWNDRLFELLELDKTVILNASDPGKDLRDAQANWREYDAAEYQAGADAQEAAARDAMPYRREQQLPNGKWIECRVRSTAGGGFLTIYRDIDESKRLHERLELQASTDSLTEVANRRSFFTSAEAEFNRAKRYGRSVSFLMIDLDHFKSVNDDNGHAAGDDVLRQVAAACRHSLRDSDILGRIGGEEFAVLLPETGAETALLAAERLRHAVAELAIESNSGPLHVTVSIGAATASPAQGAMETIMLEADDALYRAKHEGRNRVARFVDI